MQTVLSVLLGLFFGYFVATITESLVHNHVLHARKKTRDFWERHPTLCFWFIRCHYSHHVIHHSKTFRHDFVTQFESEEERIQLDSTLNRDRWDAHIITENYGTTLVGLGIFWFALPALMVASCLYFIFGPLTFLVSLFPITVYAMLSKFVHPLLHKEYNEACLQSNPAMRILLRCNYVRYIARYHYLHHKYLRCNYNLLLGGDFLPGVFRKPTKEDIAHMSDIGLSVE